MLPHGWFSFWKQHNTECVIFIYLLRYLMNPGMKQLCDAYDVRMQYIVCNLCNVAFFSPHCLSYSILLSLFSSLASFSPFFQRLASLFLCFRFLSPLATAFLFLRLMYCRSPHSDLPSRFTFLLFLLIYFWFVFLLLAEPESHCWVQSYRTFQTIISPFFFFLFFHHGYWIMF